MDRRASHKSGTEIPVLGVGAWSFGGGADDYWGAQEQSEVEAIVNAALDEGINYFDTAEAYNDGRSEESLGDALRSRRDEAIIGSKISPENTEPSVIREHCEASLRRLRTGYIDLYMVHWPIRNHSVEEAFGTLAELQSEGKIRAIGVSNFGPRDLSEALATGAGIAVNQLHYNLLSRAIEHETLPLCRQHDIGVLAYMPLLQGVLTGKYPSLDETPPNRLRTRHFRGDRPGARHGTAGAEEEVRRALGGIRVVADELDIPMGHLALAWVASQPGVTSVIAGARNVDQLRRNAEGCSISLSADTVARLDRLTDPVKQKLGPNIDYWQNEANSRCR
jgi:myo-inositol catabolism protein IolS